MKKLTPSEIKQSREERLRLTQAELAALLGVAQSRVAMWETGPESPPAYLRLALTAIEYEDAIAAARVGAPVAVTKSADALERADRLAALLPMLRQFVRTVEFEQTLLESWGTDGAKSWIAARRVTDAATYIEDCGIELQRLAIALMAVAANEVSQHPLDPRNTGGVIL